MGSTIGVIKEDTRSLDCSSYDFLRRLGDRSHSNMLSHVYPAPMSEITGIPSIMSRGLSAIVWLPHK